MARAFPNTLSLCDDKAKKFRAVMKLWSSLAILRNRSFSPSKRSFAFSRIRHKSYLVLIARIKKIEKGDKIRAYILKGKEESFMETGMEPILGGERCVGSALVEREFYETEDAIKIEKIKKGQVVATYRN